MNILKKITAIVGTVVAVFFMRLITFAMTAIVVCWDFLTGCLTIVGHMVWWMRSILIRLGKFLACGGSAIFRAVREFVVFLWGIKSFSFQNIFAKINILKLNASAFLLASLIFASFLCFTERNREVTVYRVYQETVLVRSADGTVHERVENIVRAETQIGESWVDCWFMVTSALCVTGLSSTDLSQFTVWGQSIILLCIQMGAIGVLVFGFILMRIIAEKVSRREDVVFIFEKLFGIESDLTFWATVRAIAYFTIAIEGAGFLILWHRFSQIPETLGGLPAWYVALFHAVSAFCNAGFSVFADNLVRFAGDVTVNLTVSALIILGGLGFGVLAALYFMLLSTFFPRLLANGGAKKIMGSMANVLHTRMVLRLTFFLLFLGTAGMLCLDFNNPMFEGLDIGQKLLRSFFHSVSARTAGFNTVDVGALSRGVQLLLCLLMFIGAGPGSNAGGIKLTTAYTLWGHFRSWFSDPFRKIIVLGYRLDAYSPKYAIQLVLGTFLFLSGAIFLLCVALAEQLQSEGSIFSVFKIFFEMVSAFGTVGLSMGFAGGPTSFCAVWNDAAKIILIFVMLVGRIGPNNLVPLILLKAVPEPDEKIKPMAVPIG